MITHVHAERGRGGKVHDTVVKVVEVHKYNTSTLSSVSMDSVTLPNFETGDRSYPM